MTDRLRRDAAALTKRIRSLFEHDRCALAPQGMETLRPLFVLAAASQCCVFVDRIASERAAGDEMVGRVMARAHVEAWLHGMYVHLGGMDQLREVVGAYKWSLERYERALARLDIEIATDEGDPMALDLSPLLSQFGDVEARELKIDILAKRVHREMKKREPDAVEGAGRQAAATVVYDLVYRSLSTFGAHPNYWTIDSYIAQPGWFLQVSPRSSRPTMLNGILHTAILLTADLALRGFEDLGCEAGWLDALVTRYSQSAGRHGPA